jgi:transcriptional regulator with XRE-family HTH domain
VIYRRTIGFKREFRNLPPEIKRAARKTHEYRAEGASIEFTNAMLTRMRQLDVSRSELAARIGVNPAYISKILRGDTNFSLETMVKIANALESEFRCHLEPACTDSPRLDGQRANGRAAVSISHSRRRGKSMPQRRHRRARQRTKSTKLWPLMDERNLTLAA